jgi:hypothetical protein
MSEFSNHRRAFATRSHVDQPRLGNLIRFSEVTFISSHELHHPLVRAVPLRAHIENSTSANIGRILLDLDVELRRCASYLTNGSIRPSRARNTVELISAQHGASIDLVVAVASEPFNVVTARPFDFLVLLDWCWSRRVHRTRTRRPYEELEPVRNWQRMAEMASTCIGRSQPVSLSMNVAADGSTTFAFVST